MFIMFITTTTTNITQHQTDVTESEDDGRASEISKQLAPARLALVLVCLSPAPRTESTPANSDFAARAVSLSQRRSSSLVRRTAVVVNLPRPSPATAEQPIAAMPFRAIYTKSVRVFVRASTTWAGTAGRTLFDYAVERQPLNSIE